MKNLKESGRSMVEMLGVLAIIGVLSVMGITGYTTAMKKHKANTLFNEAMKRAVTISGQLGLGSESPSLSGFDNTTDYGTFLFTAPTAGETQFALEISGMTKDVCDQVKAMAETSDAVKKTEALCDNGFITLSFNNDLGTGEVGSGESGGSVSDVSRDIGVCENGNVYFSYMDDPCATEIPQDLGCKKNSDCTEGEYCNLVNTDDSPWVCDKMPDTGTCEQITSSDYTDATVTGLGAVRMSNNTMSWWAAENWCKAQGMRLVTIEEIGCYKSGTTTLVTEGSEYFDGCCAEGQNCSADGNWSNNSNKRKYSTILYNLAQTYGNTQWFWTASNYSSRQSCQAFDVRFHRGGAGSDYRYYPGDYALCVET